MIIVFSCGSIEEANILVHIFYMKALLRNKRVEIHNLKFKMYTFKTVLLSYLGEKNYMYPTN